MEFLAIYTGYTTLFLMCLYPVYRLFKFLKNAYEYVDFETTNDTVKLHRMKLRIEERIVEIHSKLPKYQPRPKA